MMLVNSQKASKKQLSFYNKDQDYDSIFRKTVRPKGLSLKIS